MLVSSAAGSLASYMVTKAETQKCSDFWIYLETGKSPQEHTMADGLSQPTGIFHVSLLLHLGLSCLLQLFAVPALLLSW